MLVKPGFGNFLHRFYILILASRFTPQNALLCSVRGEDNFGWYLCINKQRCCSSSDEAALDLSMIWYDLEQSKSKWPDTQVCQIRSQKLIFFFFLGGGGGGSVGILMR